jgi:hypothetical protein
MPKRKRVAFARINRRSETEGLGARNFSEDMRMLSQSHQTRALFRGHEWVAADMRLLPSEDFMTGVLGFADEELFRDLDPAAFSWLKGPSRTVEGASERTMVPFAIDLRESERWIAFGTSLRIQPPGFTAGFEATLNAAVAAVGNGLMPTEWEVDLVTGPQRVEEWLEIHPNVTKFTRVVRLHNPREKLDADRAEMKALAARTKTETFSISTARGQHLNVRNNPEFESRLEGLDTGDLDVYLEARDVERGTKVVFSSKQMVDKRWVDDYGDDLELGMELMLRAVQEYAIQRAGGQGRMM